ncbi:hypothetical protein PQ465_11405 [Sphingobacterium oryzagri]|uniref:Response regulatory domain-containing protein n=1 Tax=Sphingobacterium oryzagri TaxID=3025669 RepID=A0ABY7WEN3_9SPHI|nr:hypothetical protein [Sphingobacterium sp. KACC 22765]WDF66912.1 hypothetical protein PQ465_11405 [Sphingobacterium sp. KACC 22765]
MEKIDVGIISSCKNFRIALDTILSCESDGQVINIWSEKDLDFAHGKNNTPLKRPTVVILDTDNSQIPISNLLEIIRSSFHQAKLILMLGKRKFDSNLITKYQIDKILKRTCSESELLSAVRFCADHSH